MREFTFHVSRTAHHVTSTTHHDSRSSSPVPKAAWGRRSLACAPQHPELKVVGQIDQGDDLQSVIGQGDVVIDFSSHSATPAIAALCAAHRKAMVIGTTGHSDEGKTQIADCQSQIPMVLVLQLLHRASTRCSG